MIKIHIILFFVSFLACYSYPIKTVLNFKKIKFNLKNEIMILQYKNIASMKFGGGSIFFIFDEGWKPSTNIYLYDSYDKIKKGEIGFINSLQNSTLRDTKYFEIKSQSGFINENTTYYLVLYDIDKSYEDSVYVVNTLDFFPLYDTQEIYYIHKIEPNLNFNFIIPKKSSGYFHYQSRKDPFNVLGTSSYYYFKIFDNNGTTFIDGQTNGVNGYIKLDYNLEYYVQICIMRSRFYYIKLSSFMLPFTKNENKFWLQDYDITLDALSRKIMNLYFS